MDCVTALPSRLPAVPVSFEPPPLPSMAGGDVNELHQLYFVISHGALVNNNEGYYQCGKSYGMDVNSLTAMGPDMRQEWRTLWT